MDLLLSVLSALSLALIVSRSKIFRFLPRKRFYFLACLQCQSLWMGTALAYWTHQNIHQAILAGLIASGAGYSYNRIFPEIRVKLDGN